MEISKRSKHSGKCLLTCMSVCFRFFSLYHNAVSTRVKELASEDLEANEIVSLLTWVLNTYKRYTHTNTHFHKCPSLCPCTLCLSWDIHQFKDRTLFVTNTQAKLLRLSYAVSGNLDLPQPWGFAFLICHLICDISIVTSVGLCDMTIHIM